jgi:hypothetical protein
VARSARLWSSSELPLDTAWAGHQRRLAGGPPSFLHAPASTSVAGGAGGFQVRFVEVEPLPSPKSVDFVLVLNDFFFRSWSWEVCSPPAPPSRRRAAARHGAQSAAFAAPLLRGPATQTGARPVRVWPNAHRRGAPAGGDRPSGTDMKRVAPARTTGWYRKSVSGTTKHTGGSRTHTHEHQSCRWREARLGRQLGTASGTKGGPVQRRRWCSTNAVQKYSQDYLLKPHSAFVASST